MTDEEIKALQEKAAQAESLALHQRAMASITTEDELLEAAGVHPGAVEMNDGMLTAAQEAAIAKTHSPAVAGMLIKSMKAKVAEVQKQKKKVQTEKQELLKSFFPDVKEEEVEAITQNVNKWAEEKLPPDELGDMKKLINAGGTAQKLAMKELIKRYKSENGIDQKMTGGLESGAGSFTADYISITDWFNEKEKLKKAGKSAGSREMKALDDRRLRSLKQERK
jgi:hypothetical protein